MKKFISFFMILVMLAGILISCGENETPADISHGISENDNSSETSENISDEIPDVYGKDIPVKNLEGRTFRILSNDWGAGSTSILGFNGEIIQREDFDETTAGIVDIAKYETRKLIEERYNCKFEGDLNSEYSYFLKIKDTVHGDIENGYDIYFTGWGTSGQLIGEGYLMDIASIRTIDLSNPWWDQGAVKDMSINHKLFWVTGDINTFDNEGTWVILYNKDLLSEYHSDLDIYSIVDKGDWTLEKMKQLGEAATYDLNDDGKMDEFDNWGFATEKFSLFFHVIAAGQRLSTKDSDDWPVLSYNTEPVINALMPAVEYYLDDNKVIVANTPKYESKGYPNVWEATTIKSFSDGRVMFFCCALFNLVGFRELEFKYGILPMPKATAEQDSYYHSSPGGNMSTMSITRRYADIADYDDLGLVLEALGAESKNYVTPVFYEKSLKGRDANSLEDERMLDLIFSTKIYDLVIPFNWGTISTQVTSLDNSNIISRFEAVTSMAQSDLEKFIDMIKELDF